MDASVLANLRPSLWVFGGQQTGEVQAYSQPMTKNGLPRSYILRGPDMMRPLFTREDPHAGHAIPLNTRG